MLVGWLERWGRVLRNTGTMDSHGQGAKDDEQHGKGEDCGDAGGQADDHGQDAKPGEVRSACMFLR